MFRGPDAERAPNWSGNLKQYQLATQINCGRDLYLADASSPVPQAAADNFISPTALSFWTTPSTFWSCTLLPEFPGHGRGPDSPDGDPVEKGAVAQKLRTAPTRPPRPHATCTPALARATRQLDPAPRSRSAPGIRLKADRRSRRQHRTQPRDQLVPRRQQPLDAGRDAIRRRRHPRLHRRRPLFLPAPS